MASGLFENLQETLGDAYSLERELGGGGMSRVFLATEQSLSRRVVIKVLPPELSSRVSEARFQREIRVTASLQHPHVMPVLATGAGRGLLYYITPFVEGQSLRERLALDGRLPVADAEMILREVASGLIAAHARGIVHRDVKPANILLSEGHAILADFGIARALQKMAGDQLTSAGYGVGTPGYMAPEQIVGNYTVDARADVFALGVVGYEMLTGRPPFGGNTPHSRVKAYFEDPPQPLEQLRPEAPLAMVRAIMRALSTNPELRFASASEFCDALVASPYGGSIAARRRRRRIRMMLGGLTAVAVLLAAVLGSRFGQRGVARAASLMATGADEQRKTLAVLPFRNLGRPEDAYFADGVTEELTSRLSSLSGLGIISRTSADQYRGSDKPLREIARELGANYVLEGSVRWEPGPDGRGRVRVTPQLIRVKDDSHLWAGRYDAELRDVFGVQTQIAEQVAAALSVALGGDERRQMDTRPTESVAAYDAYMRGERLRVRESTNPASLTRAATLLADATTLDPRFALAFAKLSMAEQMMYDRFYDHTPRRRDAARAAADSALALAPALPAAHLALGRILESDGDLDGAGREYALAERGQPGDGATVARTAAVLARRGRWADALIRLQRAAELDPRSVEANLAAAEGFAFTRNYRAATGYLDRALVADSDAIEPYVTRARLQVTLGGDRVKARESTRAIIERFGADRAAAADGFDALVGLLDSTDRAGLARVPPSAFGGNRIVYLFWRVELFDGWRPSVARAHADSLIVAADDLIRAEPDDYRIHAVLGWLQAVQGRPDDAVHHARRAMEIMPLSRDALVGTDAAQMAAGTYLRVGRLDDAVTQLEQLLRVPSMVSLPMLRTDPFWSPLRGNPRFERLLARGS